MTTPLYVFANGQNATGNELWIAGSGLDVPRLLKDLHPGAVGSDPDQFTSLSDGRLLFVADDGVHGREIWTTDGTSVGTRMLRDIGMGDGTRGPEQLTALPNGLVLFTADDGRSGRELWVTDGTASGTKLLSDVHAGAEGAAISNFIALSNGHIVFTADDGVHGPELWSTDGTVAGTQFIEEAAPGAFGSSFYFSRIDSDGRAVFSVSPTLGFEGDWVASSGEWRSDGTVEGTARVSDANPTTYGQPAGPDGDLYVYKGFYFGGGSEKNYVQALYVLDGTGAQPRMLLDHLGSPGAESRVWALGNGQVVFSHFQDLWVTDGTEAGTKIIGEGALIGQWADSFTTLGNGKLLFSNADNYVDGHGETTSDLWVTDGTTEGTLRLTGQLPDGPSALPDTAEVLSDGTVLFTAKSMDGDPSAVWKVDLAAGSVERLQDVHAWKGDISVGEVHPAAGGPTMPQEPSDPVPLPPAAAYVFINAEGQHGNEIWVADGEFGERRLLKDINPGLASSDPTELTHLGGGKAIFVANDDIHGRELWITDGTGAGTQMLRDIGTGDGTYGPTNLVATGDGRAFFTADDGIHGKELWVTDGTWEGTGRLMDGVAGAEGSSPDTAVAIGNGHWVFSALTGDGVQELWATDGTAGGTGLIRPVSAAEYLNILDIDVSHEGGKALVTTSQGTFTTDGTTAGTTDLVTRASYLDFHAVEGGRWVFAEYDRTHSSEYEKSLYSTDGTAEGTIKLLSPQEQTIGGRFSGETKMADLGNGQVIFQGARDLYVTDGTKAGTHVIGDDILTFHFATDFVSLGNGHALFMNGTYTDTLASPKSADLWVTDGTAQGTFQIADAQAWNAGSLPDEVSVLADGSVVFSAASMDGNPNAVWHVSMWAGGLERLNDVTNWAGELQPTQVIGLEHNDVWA